MNLKKQMVIIDDKIVTKDLSYCNFNPLNGSYNVKYKDNNKTYNYSKNRIISMKNPQKINLKKYDIYCHDKLLQNLKEIYEFKYNNKFYYYVIFQNNKYAEYCNDDIKKINKDSSNIIEYLKEVSVITSLETPEGKKTLFEQMKKVKIDDLNSALANYFKLTNDLSRENKVDTLIFPFGCNSSQYEAVQNAIYNKISVIEGPPGTGKTQTILNIIANIIIRDMNCQIVSNNNVAIKNIDEKLKKYDLDFLKHY